MHGSISMTLSSPPRAARICSALVLMGRSFRVAVRTSPVQSGSGHQRWGGAGRADLRLTAPRSRCILAGTDWTVPVRTSAGREEGSMPRDHRRRRAEARAAARRAGQDGRHRPRTRQRDPLRARAHGDVCRLAGHRPPRHRVARRARACCAGSRARAPSSRDPGCSPTSTSPRSPQDMRRRGKTPSTRGRPASRRPHPRPTSPDWFGLEPGRPRPSGSSAAPRRRASRWRSRRAGTPPRLLPGLDRHDLGRSLYELLRAGVRPGRGHRRADGAGRGRPTPTWPATSTSPSETPSWPSTARAAPAAPRSNT